MSHDAALPPAFYRSQRALVRTREEAFATTWHLSLDGFDLPPQTARPFVLHEGFLDEPLLWTADDAGARTCLSNVCTHRGNLLLDEETNAPRLRCGYHGRCFDRAGRVVTAPGFDGVARFPSASDHLPAAQSGSTNGLPFVALDPADAFEDWSAEWRPYLDGMGLASARFDRASVRSFEVAAHWALYVENYLEGFHVPYVHPELARSLGSYRITPLPRGVVQAAGPGKASAEPLLELPAGHPCRGEPLVALYLWLFPATMINVYPWGASLNVVTPLGLDATRVTFADLVLRPELRAVGAGGPLDLVEQQDEHIVERVQRGVRARLYRPGRLAPGAEAGLSYFQARLSDFR